MAESKGDTKAVKPVSTAPQLRTKLSMEECTSIRESAARQELQRQVRRYYAHVGLDKFIEPDTKELGRVPVAYTELLDILTELKKIDETKVKKTTKMHFVTINPKPDVCWRCFQDKISVLHYAGPTTKNKILENQWVLEWCATGKIHAHLLLTFQSEIAQSQVRDRVFKKFSQMCDSKQHIVVKSVNNVKGILEYMDNTKKEMNPEKKAAAKKTAEMRAEFKVRSMYRCSQTDEKVADLQSRLADEDHELPGCEDCGHLLEQD